jgi:integrase
MKMISWISPRGQGKHNVGSQAHFEKGKISWIVDYVDQHAKRHIKTFRQKKEADHFHASVKIDVSRGTHTPESRTITVAEAAENWLRTCENNGLERSTLQTYRQYVHLHIVPFLGRMKLSQLSTTTIRSFEDKLRSGAPAPGAAEGAARSPVMVRKVRTHLSSLIADAQERGQVARNVVRELRSGRRRGVERRADRRQKGKLKLGEHIPTPEEMSRFLAALEGRWRPILLTAVFPTGLRASELRGQGMHSLRHFYASWCINSEEDGGMALLPKVVQERLGHSSILMTYDRYGHLFPRGDDHAKKMADAETKLMGLRLVTPVRAT